MISATTIPVANLFDLMRAVARLIEDTEQAGYSPETVYLEPPCQLGLRPQTLTDGSIALDLHIEPIDA